MVNRHMKRYSISLAVVLDFQFLRHSFQKISILSKHISGSMTQLLILKNQPDKGPDCPHPWWSPFGKPKEIKIID